MKKVFFTASFAAAGFFFAPATQAQVAGVLSVPPTVVGGVLGGASTAHIPLANVVNGVAPQVAPTTESVTHSLAELSNGATGTGAAIQQNGIGVLPSSTTGKPLVSIGSPNPATQGSVAAVANGPLN